MASDALTAELMAVPGVASAEVDDPSAAVPAGVRVKLSAEADPRRVGAEVQRILAAHGMRSRFAEASPPAATPPPPAAGDSLVVLPPPPEGAPPSVDVAPVGAPPTLLVAPGPEASAGDEPAPVRGVAMGEVSAGPAASVGVPAAEVASVAVEERADGVTVTVTLADGRTSTQPVVDEGRGGLDRAIVQALFEAASVAASVIAIEWIEDGADAVVTVAARSGDGAPTAGVAVVTVGRALAVGYAARRALTSPEG